jgi:glutamate carboxypeptidase
VTPSWAAAPAAVDEAFEATQVAWLRRVVEQPSHTYARADVEAAAAIVDELAAEVGLVRTLHPDPSGKFADHRVYATPATGAEDRALALVGHIDTVFPRALGFLEFRREDDAVFGPRRARHEVRRVVGAVRPAGAAARRPGRARGPARARRDRQRRGGRLAEQPRALRPPRAADTAGLVFESGRKQDLIVTARKGGGCTR